ncbi:hypothetical protein JK358_31315 [Nocardia sp. 2]|uniref:VCBS repeat-containing protein n=1 Tax=Nocardia acididurans TaxID=2802282 RepID=A0ABS1ME67_9NOCA|nr:hypothetical protein [Nocardia acididurans]MBL1078903.1 hypothetical protein [Nocardia acididurans]
MDFRDGSGWSFIARYTSGDNGATQSIEVIDNTGVTRQTLVERDLYTQYSPRFEDLDGDGRDEVVIPRDLAANGNVTYAVYRWATAEFVRAGELNGYGPERTPSGYIGIAAKDTYIYWQVGFWTFENHRLREAVHVEIESRPNDTGGGGTSICRITDASGLSGSGLTDADIQQRFCAEPIVRWATPFK